MLNFTDKSLFVITLFVEDYLAHSVAELTFFIRIYATKESNAKFETLTETVCAKYAFNIYRPEFSDTDYNLMRFFVSQSVTQTRFELMFQKLDWPRAKSRESS